MTYVPSPGNVQDTYRELLAWVGPDAHRGTAAVALSTHHEMAELSRETRTAVLAMFKPEDEPCVAGLDWSPSADPAPMVLPKLYPSADELRPYAGRWVAIKDGSVIASEKTIGALVSGLISSGMIADSCFFVPTTVEGLRAL